MTKTCSKCGEEKSVNDFGKNKCRSDGRQSYCKVCMLKFTRAHRADHPEKYRGYEKARMDRDPEKEKRRRRAVQIKIRYGLTIEEYEDLIASGCQICGRQPGESQIVMDHDHETGLVRAALCHRCNVLLGYAEDDPDRLQAAIDYLINHKEKELV